jgi:DNA-binding MarR family transcriptional regulator
VVDETIGLFHRVRFVAEEIYGPEGRSTARRGVLRGLSRFGPQTVPQLARARSVTRQHVQEVADALVREGQAQWAPNPRHKRSRLLKVTARGAALVHEMDRIDDRVLNAVGARLPRADLAVTVRTLKALREGFELSARWRAVL